MKRRKQVIIALIILILSVVIIVASSYYKINYAEQTFDTIIYHLARGPEKANTEVVGKALKVCIIPIILLVIIMAIPLTSFKKKIKIKKFQIYPNEKILNNKIKYAVIILSLSVIFALGQIGLYSYIINQFQRSKIFEEEYVASENVKISFPKEKRNLIYIFLESMETTVASTENGGGWKYSIIPELEELAIENINFSNTEKLGGARPVPCTGWTVAGMVAQTSGIPLKMDISANSYKGYSSFLPGVYSLGDILKKEGYNLELMVGSDAEFGGRKDYFTVHGNYEIFDLNTAIKEGKMTDEDEVWWGYDDDDLFKWAKDEILELAAEDKPFNFVMLTADTHFMDGYLSENVGDEFETQYENIFAYSSKSVYEFVEWMKKQDFYDNTTIVIVGDHIGMQTEFYEEHLEKGYTRTVYNTFINSAIPAANSKNRQFSTLDIFPTVLASIGAEIEGERLGLGTNLFSGEPTLIEKYGYEFVNDELSKRSNYYNKYLLQDNYIEKLTNSTKNITTNNVSE
ncbi:MAG: LTA synthase family protein [Clostridia bacterium]